ncbi:hypothetical protein C0583_01855 [Candidatus Parcubacteria bacterium]|nr:MAG: hypothetical protein C0583_01855 [Candidatus Parcubacteria bacterium]
MVELISSGNTTVITGDYGARKKRERGMDSINRTGISIDGLTEDEVRRQQEKYKENLRKEKEKYRKIAVGIFEVFDLLRTPRSGWRRVGVPLAMIENVAEHDSLTVKIGIIIAILEGEDPGLTACSLAFHDSGESRTGDPDKMFKRYFPNKKEAEKLAFSDFTDFFPGEVKEKLLSYFNRFEEQKEIIDKIGKDADLLQMIFQARYLESIGFKFAKLWYENSIPLLHTKSAKKIADVAIKIDFWQWCLEK